MTGLDVISSKGYGKKVYKIIWRKPSLNMHTNNKLRKNCLVTVIVIKSCKKMIDGKPTT